MNLFGKILFSLACFYVGLVYIYPLTIHLLFWNSNKCFYDFPAYTEIMDHRRGKSN